MTIFRIVLGVAAFLCGVRALGYWSILQVGGVQPPRKAGIVLVVCVSALLFVILTAASAYLRERHRGVKAMVVKTLYLSAAHGLPSIGLFTIASKGAVLEMPEVTGVLVMLVCFAVLLRPRVAVQT
jgi:hypothetical protein